MPASATARHFIVATAGHVDHGKSSLVRALTGIDPDRLPEEKSRGITLDLGFAHLSLQARDSDVHLGIIDVPGHEDLVRNMAAGVGSANLALLVIAADEGWMPQTEEHVQILTHYRVPHAVVALTKIDLITPAALETVTGAVSEKLAGTPYAMAPIVATSVSAGLGLEELKRTLLDALEDLQPLPDLAKPRLPVDRVFSLQGIGTVVTGVLTGGTFRRAQTVLIQPSGIVSRIRSLQSHNRDLETVSPGQRAALNLSSMAGSPERSRRGGKQAVCRGDVVTIDGVGMSTVVLDAMLEWPNRPDARWKIAPGRKLEGVDLQLHIGTAAAPARIRLVKQREAPPVEGAIARIRLGSPVLALAGDRFIVRDPARHATLAGGVVLDPAPPRRGFGSENRQDYLRRKAAANSDARASVALEVNWRHAVRREYLHRVTRFSRSEIEAAISELVSRKELEDAEDWVLDCTWWRARAERAGAVIDRFHELYPDRSGIPLVDLRAALPEDAALSPQIFELLCSRLARLGYAQAGSVIGRAAHKPVLPRVLENTAARIRARLAEKQLEPPARNELAPDAAGREALRFLVQTGEVVEVGSDILLLTGAFQAAAATVRKYLERHQSATVSELRKALGSTRRVVVPLLEKLDRERVTCRQGDRRFLREGVRAAAPQPPT